VDQGIVDFLAASQSNFANPAIQYYGTDMLISVAMLEIVKLQFSTLIHFPIVLARNLLRDLVRCLEVQCDLYHIVVFSEHWSKGWSVDK